MASTSTPTSLIRPCELNTLEQRQQLGSAQAGSTGFRARPIDDAPIKPLRCDVEAALVIPEKLYPVCSLVAEHEEVPTASILARFRVMDPPGFG
jgi:hypothetical protein